jgi:hypothetical protein
LSDRHEEAFKTATAKLLVAYQIGRKPEHWLELSEIRPFRKLQELCVGVTCTIPEASVVLIYTQINVRRKVL